MPRVMLFCTVNVPDKTIDELLHTCVRFSKEPKNGPLSIVRDRTQPTLELPTMQPVSNFESGFINASLDEIGTFFRARYEQRFGPYPKGSTEMSHKTFAVLDERSLRDKTTVIAKWWFKNSAEEREADGADEMYWKALRVPWFAVAHVVEAIDEASFLYLDEAEWNPGKRRTKDGVFVVWGMGSEYEMHGWVIKTTDEEGTVEKDVDVSKGDEDR